MRFGGGGGGASSGCSQMAASTPPLNAASSFVMSSSSDGSSAVGGESVGGRGSIFAERTAGGALRAVNQLPQQFVLCASSYAVFASQPAEQSIKAIKIAQLGRTGPLAPHTGQNRQLEETRALS